MFLSVIIQAKNPIEELALTVFDIHKFCKDQKIKHEIILVEEAHQGSDIQEMNKRMQQNAPQLRVMKTKEAASASALSQAIDAAKGDWVLIADQRGLIHVQELEKVMHDLNPEHTYITSCKHNSEKISFLGIKQKSPEHQLILSPKSTLQALQSDIERSQLAAKLPGKTTFKVTCQG